MGYRVIAAYCRLDPHGDGDKWDTCGNREKTVEMRTKLAVVLWIQGQN